MNTDRDKFLTNMIGECWHDGYWYCCKCEEEIAPCRVTYNECCDTCGTPVVWKFPNNFSTWEGFGKLWEWAQRQEWWWEFREEECYTYTHDLDELIHPDRFADAVYRYLKESNNGIT